MRPSIHSIIFPAPHLGHHIAAVCRPAALCQLTAARLLAAQPVPIPNNHPGQYIPYRHVRAESNKHNAGAARLRHFTVPAPFRRTLLGKPQQFFVLQPNDRPALLAWPPPTSVLPLVGVA